MLRLEDVQRIFIDDPNDIDYLWMVYYNACEQFGVDETIIEMILKPIGFFGLKGHTVHFENSAYDKADLATKVRKRIFERLYNTRGVSHNLYAFLPDEPRPVKFELLLAQWDIHKLNNLGK